MSTPCAPSSGKARPDVATLADALGQKLREVTDEFLAHENRDRPDYLDGILAPPLAPGGRSNWTTDATVG